jgi:hypothetical protein
MSDLSCGCGPSSTPPYVHFCARHDPVRIEALERLCHDILARAKAVADKMDSSVGVFFPRAVNVSASDAMDDLLDEFAPRFRKPMTVGPPNLGGGSTPPGGPLP